MQPTGGLLKVCDALPSAQSTTSANVSSVPASETVAVNVATLFSLMVVDLNPGFDNVEDGLLTFSVTVATGAK